MGGCRSEQQGSGGNETKQAPSTLFDHLKAHTCCTAAARLAQTIHSYKMSGTKARAHPSVILKVNSLLSDSSVADSTSSATIFTSPTGQEQTIQGEQPVGGHLLCAW